VAGELLFCPYFLKISLPATLRFCDEQFGYFLATLARLLGPGGVRSIVAESLILKHQLLIVARSRQRSPNLWTSDRILAGLMALLVRPTRLLRPRGQCRPHGGGQGHTVCDSRRVSGRIRMLKNPATFQTEGSRGQR
jgi:hypothetical protein